MSANSERELRSFPFEITPFQLAIPGAAKPKDYVRVGPKKYTFSAQYKDHAVHFYNFETRPEDVWICTFPRSGTTFTQDLVWLLENNLDFESSLKTPLAERVPYFEQCLATGLVQSQVTDEDKTKKEIGNRALRPAYKFLVEQNGGRYIKTHMPLSLLPADLNETGAKVIYVARHPKDVAISYYYLVTSFKDGFGGTFDDFWNNFQNNDCTECPYWSHIEEGWQARNKPNVLFFFYEDIINDIGAVIRKVAKFLNKDLTNEQLELLKNHLDFSKFKDNPSITKTAFKDFKKPGAASFVRRGKSHGWQPEYSPELRAQAEKWIDENLQNTTLRFPEVPVDK